VIHANSTVAHRACEGNRAAAANRHKLAQHVLPGHNSLTVHFGREHLSAGASLLDSRRSSALGLFALLAARLC
jgi:hypothetical protein